MPEIDWKLINVLKRVIQALEEQSSELKEAAKDDIYDNPTKEELDELKVAKQEVESLEEDIAFFKNIKNDNQEVIAKMTFEQEKLLVIIRAAAELDSDE